MLTCAVLELDHVAVGIEHAINDRECVASYWQLTGTQESLRQEAQAVERLDFLVMRRVLSPVQAAVFVADAYPARPDALVLASTCASVGGGFDSTSLIPPPPPKS